MAAPLSPHDATEPIAKMLEAEEAPEEGTQEPAAEPEPDPPADASPEEPEAPETDEEPEDAAAEPGEEGEDPDASPEEYTATVVVQGEKREVPLSDLIAGYQQNADYTQKTMALAEQRRGFQQKIQEIEQQRAADAQRLDGLVGALTQNLQAAASGVNWEQLREDDPIEYVRQKEKFQEQQALASQAQQHQQAIIAQQVEQRRPVERQALAERIPEWSDPQVMQKGIAELGAWLAQAGLADPADWNQVEDHRVVYLAEMARRGIGRQIEAARQAPVLKKKVARLPKVQRASASRDTDAAREAKRTQALKQLSETGRLDHAVDALLGG